MLILLIEGWAQAFFKNTKDRFLHVLCNIVPASSLTSISSLIVALILHESFQLLELKHLHFSNFVELESVRIFFQKSFVDLVHKLFVSEVTSLFLSVCLIVIFHISKTFWYIYIFSLSFKALKRIFLYIPTSHEKLLESVRPKTRLFLFTLKFNLFS